MQCVNNASQLPTASHGKCGKLKNGRNPPFNSPLPIVWNYFRGKGVKKSRFSAASQLPTLPIPFRDARAPTRGAAAHPGGPTPVSPLSTGCRAEVSA